MLRSVEYAVSSLIGYALHILTAVALLSPSSPLSLFYHPQLIESRVHDLYHARSPPGCCCRTNHQRLQFSDHHQLRHSVHSLDLNRPLAKATLVVWLSVPPPRNKASWSFPVAEEYCGLDWMAVIAMLWETG